MEKIGNRNNEPRDNCNCLNCRIGRIESQLDSIQQLLGSSVTPTKTSKKTSKRPSKKTSKKARKKPSKKTSKKK